MKVVLVDMVVIVVLVGVPPGLVVAVAIAEVVEKVTLAQTSVMLVLADLSMVVLVKLFPLSQDR